MCDTLVARTGRHQQRYDSGFRLVAGCIPYRYRDSDASSSENPEKIVEVLMINSPSGPGLLFPKFVSCRSMQKRCLHFLNFGMGGWENDETDQQAAIREAIEEAGVRGKIMTFLGYYQFKSKTHQDACSPEGLCKAAVFAMLVEEELKSWPEKNTRSRKWLTIPEAAESCRHAWMREALIDGFCKWHDENMLDNDNVAD